MKVELYNHLVRNGLTRRTMLKGAASTAALAAVGGTVPAFADGHSEIHKWTDPRTMPKINKGNMQLNIAMYNSKDLYWMMEKSTRRIGRR